MFVYLFNEAVDLGMLPSASVRPVEAGRPHSSFYDYGVMSKSHFTYYNTKDRIFKRRIFSLA